MKIFNSDNPPENGEQIVDAMIYTLERETAKKRIYSTCHGGNRESF